MKPLEAMMALFCGLDRARGAWHPATGSMETLRSGPGPEDFRAHLEGRMGLGVVPILDDETCWWGAIDIDAHGDGESVDLLPLAMRVESEGLPLVVCQSKSQGAHLYLFLMVPLPAKLVQRTLKEWADRLGYPGVEVFPKQTKLAKDQVGNWINLPYFNAENTVRYAVHSGRRLSFVEFLTLASERRATKEQLVPRDSEDAPPCIHHLLTQGIDEGERNNALFAIGTYYRKRGSGDLEEMLLAVNYDKTIMPRPLQKREVASIATSLLRSNYKYRCNETPICNLCDKELCQTRKYGVGKSGPTAMYDVPLWGPLTKILSDPPRYILEVSGVNVEFTSAELLDFARVRQAVFDHAGLLIGPIQKPDWDALIKSKNELRKEVLAPEDAGPGATVLALLSEFCRTAERLDHTGQPVIGKREALLRGQPVLLLDSDTDTPLVYFRGTDFVSYLKRKRAEDAKGSALWAILRKGGCDHEKVRIGPSVIQAWTKPFRPTESEIPLPEIKEDL